MPPLDDGRHAVHVVPAVAHVRRLPVDRAVVLEVPHGHQARAAGRSSRPGATGGVLHRVHHVAPTRPPYSAPMPSRAISPVGVGEVRVAQRRADHRQLAAGQEQLARWTPNWREPRLVLPGLLAERGVDGEPVVRHLDRRLQVVGEVEPAPPVAAPAPRWRACRARRRRARWSPRPGRRRAGRSPGSTNIVVAARARRGLPAVDRGHLAGPRVVVDEVATAAQARPRTGRSPRASRPRRPPRRRRCRPGGARRGRPRSTRRCRTPPRRRTRPRPASCPAVAGRRRRWCRRPRAPRRAGLLRIKPNRSGGCACRPLPSGREVPHCHTRHEPPAQRSSARFLVASPAAGTRTGETIPGSERTWS